MQIWYTFDPGPPSTAPSKMIVEFHSWEMDGGFLHSFLFPPFFLFFVFFFSDPYHLFTSVYMHA